MAPPTTTTTTTTRSRYELAAAVIPGLLPVLGLLLLWTWPAQSGAWGPSTVVVGVVPNRRNRRGSTTITPVTTTNPCSWCFSHHRPRDQHEPRRRCGHAIVRLHATFQDWDDDEDWNHDFDDHDDDGNVPWKHPSPHDDDARDRPRPLDRTTISTTTTSTIHHNPPKPMLETSHFFSRKALEDLAPATTTPPVDPSSLDHHHHHNMTASDYYRIFCDAMRLQRPSKIQAMAWPRLRQGASAILAEQTGSGKTLAYLLPLLERLLVSSSSFHQSDTPTNSTTTTTTPRLVILTPTSELADQVYAICQRLAHAPGSTVDRAQPAPPPLFRTLVLTATGRYHHDTGTTNNNIREQIRTLQRTPRVDVLVSTPGRLATILRTRQAKLDFSHVQAMVLDEVDILMLDDTFGPQLRTIGQAAPVDQTQFVFCTATLPDAIVQKIQREFPNVQQIRGPGLHKVAPTVKERLVDVSVPAPHHRNPQMCFDVKAKALLQSLRETRCRRTLIFCNTVESCRQVENLLKRHDRQGQLYHVGAYHNALTPQARQANLRGLAREATSSDRDAILVCTDRAARGVDFGGMAVDHIVIFDFPADPAEYLRRVGRTARAGRVGTCTVLAYGWQLPTARSIMAHDGHSANGGGATTRAATLQEIRVADDGIVPDSSAVEGENDWSVGERRQKKKDAKKNGQKQKKDMKTSIERGQLWTDA